MKSLKPLLNFALAAAVAGATLLGVGCSKPAPEEEPRPVRPPSRTEPTVSPLTSKMMKAPVPTIPAPDTPVFPMPAKSDTPAAIQEIAKLETTYLGTTEFANRIEAIFKISDLGGTNGLAALGRLFSKEKDPELRSQILDSLADTPGLDEQKAALLGAGAAADQPRQVRQSAIDAMTAIEPKRAMPMLQALATDSDEEVRGAAKDAIQIVQALLAARAEPPQP